MSLKFMLDFKSQYYDKYMYVNVGLQIQVINKVLHQSKLVSGK